MEDSDRLLREKAQLKIPKNPRGERDYLVAVSDHGRAPEAIQPCDFTWFICPAKTTVEKIRASYAKKNCCDIELHLWGVALHGNTQVAELDRWGDRLVVFRGVQNDRQAIANALGKPRTPLQPVNGSHSILKSGDSPEKAFKPIKSDPDKVSCPTSDSSSLSQVNSPLKSFPTLQQQSVPIDILQPGRNIGGVVHGSRDYMPSLPPAHSYPTQSQVKIEDPNLAYIKQEPDQAPSDPNLANVGQELYQAPSDAKILASVPIPNAWQNKRLAKILAEASPEVLEAEVQSSVSLLDQLMVHLSGLPAQNAEVQQWLRQIESVKKKNINEPTIIGVVGNTGAGKSSVINAMLDEERLVPTNCMRACTAVVTEMSWNSSDDEDAKYRAEIEFIQPEDWEKELRALFAEILDNNGNISRDVYAEDSEAGVAYAKIRAVYPQKSKEEITNSNVAKLMEEQAVQNVLGTTKIVAEARSDKFYKILQTFVDSKEKSTGDKKQKKEMEYWPLIKVVKIYTKADALSTGAVIVDLPGVHDSNAARSAVAQKYMKTCTGLWIVAPITRAVDDKAAKSLLGESFKRQLKYDGTYSRVTFICSKTDDISITEASDSLGLEEEMSSKWEKLDEIERDQKRLTKQLAELRESKAVYGEVMSDADDQLEVWDKLRDDLEDGMTVYAPTVGSKKRKKSQNPTTQRKRQALQRSSDDDDDGDFTDDNSALGQEGTQIARESRGEPLTLEMVNIKIDELKSTKKGARLQRREVEAQMEPLREDLKALDSAYGKIQAEMSAICISGRNQYSKGAIQQDFAAGIKELDQENQLEIDEATFNPDEDIRDYAEVARSLPVFCVSSRAYQKLCGRLQRDKDVPGFSNLEETEIPQLQAHCKRLTEAGRTSSCHRFLNAFSQMINSLSLWSSNDGLNLSDTQQAAEGSFLKAKLAELEKGLEKAVQGCLEEMKETLSENIYEKFDQVIEASVAAANDTAARWGAPINRENRAAGGYYWSTYKAICRRDGVYASGASGLIDFNLQLTEPIIKQLGSHWEKAFARRLPHVLQSFTRSTKALLQSFHRDIQARVMKSGVGIAGLAMLGQQLHNYELIFQDIANQMIQVISERQRDANREFTPIIARHLLSAYEYCVAESGPGSYMRMKAHMNSHIDEHRNTMFHESTEEVKKHLKMMCGVIEEHMLNKVDEVFVLMRRDYLTVITGTHIPQGQVMPKWERSMKACIVKLFQEREDAAEKEENLKSVDCEMNVDKNENQAKYSIATEADSNAEANQDGEDEERAARDIAESIQMALNEEILKQIKEES